MRRRRRMRSRTCLGASSVGNRRLLTYYDCINLPREETGFRRFYCLAHPPARLVSLTLGCPCGTHRDPGTGFARRVSRSPACARRSYACARPRAQRLTIDLRRGSVERRSRSPELREAQLSFREQMTMWRRIVALLCITCLVGIGLSYTHCSDLFVGRERGVLVALVCF